MLWVRKRHIHGALNRLLHGYPIVLSCRVHLVFTVLKPAMRQLVEDCLYPSTRPETPKEIGDRQPIERGAPKTFHARVPSTAERCRYLPHALF